MLGTGVLGKPSQPAGTHLHASLQAAESKSRRDQVHGGESEGAGRQEMEAEHSPGRDAVDTRPFKARSGRWTGCVLRALGSHSGAASQGGEVPILQPSRDGEMQRVAQAGSGQAEARTSH